MSHVSGNENTSLDCPVERYCGACQLLHTPYEQQLSNKQKEIQHLFLALSDKETVVETLIGMEYPYYYRNKVVSPFARGKKLPPAKGGAGRGSQVKGAAKKTGKASRQEAPRYEILCGMYAARSHRIIPTDSCLIENRVAKQVILAIRDLMPRFRIDPYREDSGTGFLRHAVVRAAHESGEVLVTLVTNGKVFPRSKDFSRELVKRCPQVTSVVQNVNMRQTNVIFGEEESVLYGPGFILDKLCGLSFRISSSSFYQVNALQTEVLYQRAIEMAQLTGHETVIDAYCGTGTIGLLAARGFEETKRAARVIGVDEVVSAIRDARMNAKHNGIANAEFVAEDAGMFMREFAAKHEEAQPTEGKLHPVDVVLMDPPRAGASEEFLASLVVLAPNRIVYISCNPQTQARDAAYLIKRGYRIERIQAVDMFPHTEHVENIISLVR